METTALLRSFHGAMWTTQYSESFPEKPVLARMPNAASKRHAFSQPSMFVVGRKGSFLPHLKASETASALTSNAVTLEKSSEKPSDKQSVPKSTFPSGFEALLLEVCEETSVAELKLKIGTFEMHLKRDVGTPKASAPASIPIVSPTTAPPIPSEPMNESAPAAPPAAPPKPPSAPTSPFANVSSAKASKLAALEASGSNAYIIVSSPTVGTFRRGRTLKGKKQPPSCKEGDVIKEGQIIGFLDQFGNELPVRSDVAGEVLKVLYSDGEAVGYGDPLVAVLPSFHGIK
uniref:Lipoyl-binding domain-containing protein n=1 Tax=Ananas comosus var. bracteatus TaxID=296719 RepID=A0A6V7PRK1_ANACO|nr:unnamed protein product [Ananas comosus var. bracteatus]